MEENPYQPVPAARPPSRSMLLPITVAVLVGLFAAFVTGYFMGHAAGFWDAERLQIGDEAAGLEPGELP